MVRIGFWGILYCNHKKEPQNPLLMIKARTLCIHHCIAMVTLLITRVNKSHDPSSRASEYLRVSGHVQVGC